MNKRKKNALNALSVNRQRQVSYIPHSKVVVPQWMKGPDPIFQDLYEKYLAGRIPVAATRVPLDQITDGFYLLSQQFKYICDEPPCDVVEDLAREIRAGSRPSLHLYPNKNPRDPSVFLCPDDVAVSKAYRLLGIKKVPAIVLAGITEKHSSSAFKFKIHRNLGDNTARICGIVSMKPEALPSLIGSTIPVDPTTVIDILSNALGACIANLRIFHYQSRVPLHYHHMVFSAAIRAQETLRAIRVLLQQNLWYQALALLRVLYEIQLNFYFDWLQPETNYRFLAAAAVWDTNGLAKQKNLMQTEFESERIPRNIASERAALTWRGVNMASTVAEKARLSPVGIAYHKDIYSFLSQITHQDFEVASLHANRFEDDNFLTIDDDVKTTFFRFLDLVISETVVCINADLGNSK